MAWSRNTDWAAYYNVPDNLQEKYLEHIGVEKKKPSREYLDELIIANQYKIPFENIDVTHFGKEISIEPAKLFERIILRGRGGYCFQLNGLFSMLLVSLGFNAWMCPCRQMQHSEPVPVPSTHCGVLIYIDGKVLFCDVGYGGPAPMGSLELILEKLQTIRNETFYFSESTLISDIVEIESTKSGWFTLIRKSTSNTLVEKPLMQVAPIQCYLADFYGQNLLRSTGDSAYSTRHVKKRIPDGYIDLSGNVLTIVKNKKKEERNISHEEFEGILLKYFDIKI